MLSFYHLAFILSILGVSWAGTEIYELKVRRSTGDRVSAGKLCLSNFEVTYLGSCNCIDQFCPPGTFCDERPGPCRNPPCATILACLPIEANGCARMECQAPKVCVERVRPCIGRSCKEIATCETPNTCASVVCPPSQKCHVENGTPTCKKHIPPTRGIIGKAVLDEKQFQDN